MLLLSACAAEKKGGGVYSCRLTENGRLIPLSRLSCDCPTYTAVEGKSVYTLLRNGCGTHSGVIRTALLKDGSFGESTDPESTEGLVACHLTVDNGDIYTVNYLSGSCIRVGKERIAFEGHGPHKARQDASHTHCVILSPDRRYVLVTDLGCDKIHVLSRELTPVAEASVPSGSGARHIIFSQDGTRLYCINELSATVSCFAYDAKSGRLTYLTEADTCVPPDILPMNTAAAIRLSQDGTRLTVSNRGENTLVVFAVEGDRLRLLQKCDCGGIGPRDFAYSPDERYLVVTNEKSSDVAVFAVTDGKLGKMTDKLSLPSPLCVEFYESEGL